MQARLCMHGLRHWRVEPDNLDCSKTMADVRNNAHDVSRCICHQSLEEAEVISFVPGALSIPRGPVFGTTIPAVTNPSVVVDDGEEAYTINLCHQCCNVRLTARGQAPLKSWQWKASGGTESASWQTVENVGKGRVYTRNVGVLSLKDDSETVSKGC